MLARGKITSGPCVYHLLPGRSAISPQKQTPAWLSDSTIFDESVRRTSEYLSSVKRKLVGTLSWNLPTMAPSFTDHHSGLPCHPCRVLPSKRVFLTLGP